VTAGKEESWGAVPVGLKARICFSSSPGGLRSWQEVVLLSTMLLWETFSHQPLDGTGEW